MATSRYAWRVGRVLREVVSRDRVDGVMTDTLSCGHRMPNPHRRHNQRRRYCIECGRPPAPRAPDDGLSEIGRLFLRMLPPPGRPFPPCRRHAYLTTVRAIIDDTWGDADAR